MDVVWHGRGVVILLRRVVGWGSWLLVATQLYNLACSKLSDSSYFVLPVAVYRWLDDVAGTTTDEASFDLAVWSTSVSMVLVLHLLVWLIFAALKLSRSESVSALRHWQIRHFSVVGWSSWLLVSTFVLLSLSDAILRARGSELPSHTSAFLIEMIGGLLVVGSLHLAILKIARGSDRRRLRHEDV